MSLIDSFFYMFGVKRPKSDSGAVLNGEPQCPHEAEILTYSESKLSNRRRAQLESHFASCDNCRSLLVILTRFNNEPIESAPLSEEEIKKQAARVFAYIEQDDSKPRAAASETAGQEQASRKRAGIFIPYPQLATAAIIICAVLVSGIYLLTREQDPAAAAEQYVARANTEGRRSEMRISGGLGYSNYKATRGPADNTDLSLQRALNKMKDAEKDDATIKDRMVLVRVHLMFATPDHAQKALTLLQGLVSEGIQSPEVSNDLGVAHYQLRRYKDAIENFSKALEQKPDYYEALFNRAYAEEYADRKEDAKRDWQQFLNQSPDPNWKEEAGERLKMLSPTQN